MSYTYDKVEVESVSEEYEVTAYNLGIGVQSYGRKEEIELDERLDESEEDGKTSYANPDGRVKVVEEDNTVILEAVDGQEFV